MPYEIYKVMGGYKVGKSDGKVMRSGRVYASDKPLSEEKAKKQMAALYANENPSEFRSFQFEKGYKIGRKNKQKLPNGRMYSTNKFLDKEEVRAEIKRVREKYSKNEK